MLYIQRSVDTNSAKEKQKQVCLAPVFTFESKYEEVTKHKKNLTCQFHLFHLWHTISNNCAFSYDIKKYVLKCQSRSLHTLNSTCLPSELVLCVKWWIACVSLHYSLHCNRIFVVKQNMRALNTWPCCGCSHPHLCLCILISAETWLPPAPKITNPRTVCGEERACAVHRRPTNT